MYFRENCFKHKKISRKYLEYFFEIQKLVKQYFGKQIDYE